MPLTDKEKKELDMLDNPEVQFMSPATGGIFGNLFGSNSIQKRKDRVVELRTKIRMEELGLDSNNEWQKYYQIQKEENERFDSRFNLK